MDALIVYESMFGNTHSVAEAIAAGLRQHCASVKVVAVGAVTQDQVDRAGLLVVGAPTHVHGMSRPSTRRDAAQKAERSGGDLPADPGPNEPGVRAWLDTVSFPPVAAAAFDTRVDAPALLTGRASKHIAHRLRAAGLRLVAAPESFLVTSHDALVGDELVRATAWGRKVGTATFASTA